MDTDTVGEIPRPANRLRGRLASGRPLKILTCGTADNLIAILHCGTLVVIAAAIATLDGKRNLNMNIKAQQIT